MKTLPATRERKQAITAHFAAGKKAHELSDELKRVPVGVIQACQVRAFETKARKAPAQL